MMTLLRPKKRQFELKVLKLVKQCQHISLDI
jgi:hypothetical protein